jgi:hypothetical protein
MHYTGDHTVYKPFQHRSAKKSKNPYIRSSPYVNEKVQRSNILKPVHQIYQEIVNESTGGPRHAVTTPRNQKQVQNARDLINKEFRLSHDALYNIYELSVQLHFTDRKGNNKDFTTYIALHPRILIHLFPSPLLDSLNHLVNISSTPVLLHHDTVFNIGDFYMCTFTFRQSLFNENPVIP